MAKIKFEKNNPTVFKIASDEEYLNKITNHNHQDTVYDIDDSHLDNIKKDLVIVQVEDGAVTVSEPFTSENLQGQYGDLFADFLAERIKFFNSTKTHNQHIYDDAWNKKIDDYVSDMVWLSNETSLHVKGKTINQILAENGKEILSEAEVAN